MPLAAVGPAGQATTPPRRTQTPGFVAVCAGRTAIRAAAMLASWCGCEAFDFVVLAADAIEQLPAVGHPTKVSRSKWPLGKAVVAGAGPSCPSGGATE